jgi:hypothetical protein
MDVLLSGPYVTFMAVAAFLVFAWVFWDLLEEMRDGAGGRTYRPWRRRAADAAARPAAGFEGFQASPPPGGREFLQFSRTLETWVDRETREIRGRVVSGGYRGRGLETLSRTDCLRLNEYCVDADPEAARLLEAYLSARFGGGAHAKPGAGQSRARPRADAGMTREDAFAALGLAEGAGDSEIVKAHRALIKTYHPDHGGSTAKAAMINQAKDMLLAKAR